MAMMEQATAGAKPVMTGSAIPTSRPFGSSWIGRLPRAWRSITDKKVDY